MKLAEFVFKGDSESDSSNNLEVGEVDLIGVLSLKLIIFRVGVAVYPE